MKFSLGNRAQSQRQLVGRERNKAIRTTNLLAAVAPFSQKKV
jgi:hypothetical protein